ncbi:MAG: AraC family transcriptional regulator [Verrucomicrobiota bacterium]
MRYQIELAESKAVTTAVIRSRVPQPELAQFVPAACGEVWAFIRSTGLPQPGRHTALYLQDGFVEVGAEVSGPFAGNERIRCSQLPAGPVAATAHFGPYRRLGDAHGAIREWATTHRRQLAGICWEIYGHWEESWQHDPTKIRTDVFHLLRG